MIPVSSNCSNRRGVALVMVLFFISLITILVVGFLTSMRLERFSADAHLRSVRAQQLAQAGVDIIAARIAQATQTGSFWITQPGRITAATLSSTGFKPADLRTIDLHSGTMQTGDSTDLVADLNLPNLFSSTRNLITPQNVSLKTRWIYLRQDGTMIMPSGAALPTYSKSNPIVGRFAFWADDNGGRVDLNTAWRRSVTVPRWDPSQLNLTVFSGLNTSLADALKNFRTGSHFLHTVDEARAVDSSLSSVIDANRMDFSLLNRAPEINLFGQPRIMLTTKKALAGSQPYLNILADETVDPGIASNISGASATDKLAVVTASLTALLTRTDWPMNPGHSFSEKFAPVRPEQIALNIIEYVRARESTRDVVEPIRGDIASSGKVIINTSNAVTALMGNNRGPRVTEIGVWIDQATSVVSGVTGYNATYVTEVYLPPNFGITKIDLTQYAFIRLYGIGATSSPSGGPPDPSSAIVVTELDGGVNPDITAGQCRVIKHNFRINTTTRPTDLVLRVAFCKKDAFGNPGTRVDLPTTAQAVGHTGIPYKVSAAGTAVDQISSMEVVDPCVNKAKGDWQFRSVNAFGTAPSLATASASLLAQQDTGSSSTLTNSSLRFPPASGQTGNLNGVMESVAELGFVHTGVECSTNGVPLRSLRLQPQKSLQLPDWALLDLFSVPYKPTPTTSTVSYYVWNSSLGRGGLINLNAFRQGSLIPFLDSGGVSLVQRKYGLLAATVGAAKDDTGSTTIDATQADTLQANLAAYTLSSSTNAGRDYGFGKLFLSRGQLAELAGFSDGGESGEALLRGVIDLMDVRSNAFTVYSIGQAVTETANQSFIVQAEQRTETILLRDSTGKVRCYFSRNLRP